MKKLLLLTLILTVAASVGSAAPIACSTVTTLAQLITDSGVGKGCTSQGVLFNNFTYTPTAGGVAAAGVFVSLVTSDVGGIVDDGWSFNSHNQSWGAGFSLHYTVSVVPGNPLGILQLDQSADQIFLHVPSTVTATDTQTPNGITLVENGSSTNAETSQSGMYKVTSLSTSSVITVPARTTMNSYEQDFFSSSPEPVTFVLIGSGLIGLTFLRRRLNKG